jgi:hypothetical protein
MTITVGGIVVMQLADANSPLTLLKILMLAMANSQWLPVLNPLVTLLTVRLVRMN